MSYNKALAEKNWLRWKQKKEQPSTIDVFSCGKNIMCSLKISYIFVGYIVLHMRPIE